VSAFRNLSASEMDEGTVVLTAVDAYLKRAVGRAIESAEYTQVLSGSGTPILAVPQWPVTAVSSLVVDEATWAVMLQTATADLGEQCFLPDHGKWLEARGGEVFPLGWGNVRVKYTAGYATVPSDLALACVMLTGIVWKERNLLGDGYRTLGDSTVQQVIRNPREYQFITDVIDSYRRR
jgi:hypothetical protein